MHVKGNGPNGVAPHPTLRDANSMGKGAASGRSSVELVYQDLAKRRLSNGGFGMPVKEAYAASKRFGRSVMPVGAPFAPGVNRLIMSALP
jgi:hypothetical protein